MYGLTCIVPQVGRLSKRMHMRWRTEKLENYEGLAIALADGREVHYSSRVREGQARWQVKECVPFRLIPETRPFISGLTGSELVGWLNEMGASLSTGGRCVG